jgi:integrase
MIREIKTKKGIRQEARVKVGGRPYSKRHDTVPQAQRWITEMRYRRDSKIPYVRKVTIQELFDWYLGNAKLQGKAATTMAAAEQRFKKYIKPVFEGYDMVTMTVEQHEKFIGSMQQHFTITNATVNRVRSLMQVMYTQAIRKRLHGGAITVNPYTFIEKLKETPPEIDYWTTDDLQKFLNHVHGTRLYPLWVLMLNTGMRLGECMALDRFQVDTFAHVIHVRQTWCPIKKEVAARTKGRKFRKVAINASLRKALYPVLPVEGAVFVAISGKRIGKDFLEDYFKRICEEAKVKKISLHGLRHTYASQFMMAGGNVNELAETLGHATVELTRKTYIHFSDEHIQKRGRVVEFSSSGDKILKPNFS